MELGCPDVKFFPAEPIGGLTYLKSIAAPYAHLGVRFIPLGGMKVDNLATTSASSGSGGWRFVVGPAPDSRRKLARHPRASRRSEATGRASQAVGWDSILTAELAFYCARHDEHGSVKTGYQPISPWGSKNTMRIVTFGEIMGRLATSGFLRFRQALPGHWT